MSGRSDDNAADGGRSRGARIPWHILLGAFLSELLGPTGVEVRTEVEVTAGIPRADILLIRRHGTIWTDEQRVVLADGLHDLRAREILLEFKFGRSLREDDLSRLSVYDYLYLNLGEPRRREDLQSVLVSARTPGPTFLKTFGFEPLTWPGVWLATPPWGGTVRLILLNELSEAPHNAPLKLFASRIKERRRAFVTVDASGFNGQSPRLEGVFVGL